MKESEREAMLLALDEIYRLAKAGNIRDSTFEAVGALRESLYPISKTQKFKTAWKKLITKVLK